MKKDFVGIVIPGISKPYSAPLWNLIEITSSIYDVVHIFGRNLEKYNYPEVIIHSIHHEDVNNKLIILLRYLYLHLFVSFNMIKLRKQTKTWIFFLGGDLLLLPILTGKLLNNNIILLFAGSLEREITHKKNPSYFSLLIILKKISCCLSSKIIVYSEKLITFLYLEQFQKKIIVAHRHFLDFNVFKIKTPYNIRPHLIGYIGRLSAEKGIQEFTLALPAIINYYEDYTALIGGNGVLMETIKTIIQKEGLSTRIEISGWISRDELPKYLNQLRLLVIPSYSEGLPNIMLESMACGTPVLATPVGAIPDIIIDGNNGFIMENNTPECIIKNVRRALDCPELDKIVENGKNFVESNFSIESVVERWKEVLN